MKTFIKRCATCVETNTRPTSAFNEKGICVACQSVSRAATEKIDWQYRKETLQTILSRARERNSSGYDCLIGVSGGKDSTRQALVARELGLNPLLVSCQYPPDHMVDRGADNLANLISLGFDTLTITPAPGTSRDLMLHCFKTFGNLFNATELALYSSLPITALAYKIPLILLGENPGLAWGTFAGSSDCSGDNMAAMNTLRGGDPRQFAPTSVSDRQLFWYRFPSKAERDEASLRIVYLGYFISDFNDHTNSRIAIEHGLKIREGEEASPDNTGGIYPFVALDEDFVIVNQYLKYLKFGFGKATQEVGSAVRFGLMNRDEGLELVRKYDGKCAPFYIDRLCAYLGITRTEFWNIVDRHVNQELFAKNGEGEWVVKFDR